MNNFSGIPAGTPVLVTGASGFTGSVLIRRLAGAGLDVRAIARLSSNLDHLKDLKITWYRGEVYSKELVEEACRGAQYIFHLAAAYRQAGISDDTYRKVHITSTVLLAQAALRNPDFKRFIHVSTVGVHGHIEAPPANEDYRFAPGDVYQKTKAEAEEWLKNFAGAHNLPFCVIRPAAIFGPGDRRLLKVFRMASRPFYLILGSGR